jgi:DNA-directed RNA polymerase subunit F
MMLAREPLTLAEVNHYLKEADQERLVAKYIKRFAPQSTEKAKETRKALSELQLIKLKTEDIVKLVDFLPKESESVHKVCPDAGLSEEECQKILGVLAG